MKYWIEIFLENAGLKPHINIRSWNFIFKLASSRKATPISASQFLSSAIRASRRMVGQTPVCLSRPRWSRSRESGTTHCPLPARPVTLRPQTLGHSGDPWGDIAETPVTSDENDGVEPGAGNDHCLGIHSHCSGGGASGRGSGRGSGWSLPRQLHNPGQLSVQLVWARVQSGVPAGWVRGHALSHSFATLVWKINGPIMGLQSGLTGVTHVAT